MSLIFLVIISCVVSFGFIILLKPFASSLNMLDIPDGRKIHKKSTPKIGGLAIALCILPYLYFQAAGLEISPLTLLGFLFFMLLSYVDDRKELSGFIQFFCQLILAFFTVHFGNLSVHHLGFIIPGYPDLFLPSIYKDIFSSLALVGLINAFNMLDGIDGFLGSLALILSLIFLGLGIYHHIEIIQTLSTLMIGGLVSFLYFNFPRKKLGVNRIFLGDIGSTLIGFIFYWMTIEFTRPTGNFIPPIMLVWCLALPLFDMLRVMIARLSGKIALLLPDQIHVHHLLLNHGWSTPSIIRFAVLSTLIFSSIGALSLMQNVIETYLFFGFWVMFFLYRRWIEGLK